VNVVGPRRTAGIAVVALVTALLLGGCGSGGRPPLAVSAAASLRRALTRYGQRFAAADVHYSFAGSNTLAAQIEQGLRPDVFASADVQLPAMLYARRLVERPVEFAGNELVLAVPSGSAISGLAGLERPGVSVALGSATVPVGIYAGQLLARLPALERSRILGNVRDREPDVTGIVGKLVQGAVDAGVLYATDVAASGGQLRAIALPRNLQPRIAYAAAIVDGTGHPAQARKFIAGLLHGPGRAALLSAGFLAPPSR
jgi:molybdate transport system substrate-binding protein